MPTPEPSTGTFIGRDTETVASDFEQALRNMQAQMARSLSFGTTGLHEPEPARASKKPRRKAAEILAGVDLLSSLETPKAEVAKLDIPTDYFDLAQRVGLSGSETMLRARCLSAFQREELAVYDTAAVSRYLDGICRNINEAIHKAGELPQGWGSQGEARWSWKWLEVEGAAPIKPEWPRYQATVPIEAMRVMERAQNVLTEAGVPKSSYAWSASEVYEYPDPFLALGFMSKNLWFVLAHWDEPGFSILKA